MYDRISDLSLEQLRRIVHGEEEAISCGEYTSLPQCARETCMAIGHLPFGAACNDIGVIFANGDNSAEGDLVKMMAQGEKVADTAYFYLSQCRDRLSPETLALVEKFEGNPANAEMIQFVKDRVAELNSTDMAAAN